MTLTLDVGSTSEDLFQPPILEVAPVVIEESPATTFAEKLTGWRERVKCEICGQEVAVFQMGNHQRRKHGTETPKATTPKKPAAEKKPSTPREPGPRRVSAADLLTTLVTAGAGLLVNSGASGPTGMALMMEATILGPEFDRAVAGTFIDKQVVQPLVKAKSKWSGVASLAAFPICVFALDKNPQMMPMIYPALRSSMKQILPDLVTAKKRQVADERKLNEAAAELVALDLELNHLAEDRGPDPIDILISSLFAGKASASSTPEEPGSAWTDNA